MSMLTTVDKPFDPLDWRAADPGPPYEFPFSDIQGRDVLRASLRSRVEDARRRARAAGRRLDLHRGSDVAPGYEIRPDRAERACRGCRCRLSVNRGFTETEAEGPTPRIYLCPDCFAVAATVYPRPRD